MLVGLGRLSYRTSPAGAGVGGFLADRFGTTGALSSRAACQEFGVGDYHPPTLAADLQGAVGDPVRDVAEGGR